MPRRPGCSKQKRCSLLVRYPRARVVVVGCRRLLSIDRNRPLSSDMHPPPTCPVKPGDVVAGKYTVERTLGAGGMGIVVLATHTELDRKVALKFLLPQVLQQRDLVARFAREARIAAKLQSEHVARVLDVGALDADTPYIVMEFLEGVDLARLVASN